MQNSIKKVSLMLIIGIFFISGNVFAEEYDSVLKNLGISPINQETNEENLLIILKDKSILRERGTNKYDNPSLDKNEKKYYAVWSNYNPKTNFYSFTVNTEKGNKSYYTGGDVLIVKNLKKFQTRIAPRTSNEYMYTQFPLAPEVKDAILYFNDLNEKSKNKDFYTTFNNLTKTMYNMNLQYGGYTHSQGDLSDKKTRCDGFTTIISYLLNETNIEYRFIDVSDDKIKPKNMTHVYIEIKMPDGSWTNLECTLFAQNKEKKESLKDYQDRLMRHINKKETICKNTIVYTTDDTIISEKDYAISKSIIGGKVIHSTDSYVTTVKIPKGNILKIKEY